MTVQDQAKALFDEAFARLLAIDMINITADVNELNLCNRLSLHMEALKSRFGFEAYYAETEYNRKQNAAIKTILMKGLDNEFKVVTIKPDLLLHSRGESILADNIIAVEMKKAKRDPRTKLDDRLRLETMTKTSFDDVWSNDGTAHPEHVCGYQVGFYIELNPKKRAFMIEEYRGGKQIAQRSGSFAGQQSFLE